MSAGAVNIGALEVTLGLNDSQLKAGKARAQKELTALQQNIRSVGASISSTIGRATAPWLSMAAAVGAVGVAIRGAIADARGLRNLSIETGIAVSSLDQLKFAAEAAGAEFGDLRGAVLGFNEAIRADRMSAAANALRQVGVAVRDAQGNFVTLDQVLPQIADKFAGWQDGANKAAVATALFGEAGVKLLSMLNRGSAGIRELMEEATRLNSASEETSGKIDEFDKATARLSTSLKTLAMEAAPVVDAITWLADAITSLIRGAKNLNRDMKIEDLGKQAKEAGEKVADLEARLAGARSELERIKEIGDDDSEGTMVRNWTGTVRMLSGELQKARDELTALESSMTNLQMGNWHVTLTRDSKDEPKDPNAAVRAASEATSRAMENLRTMQDEMTSFPIAVSEAFSVLPSEYDKIHAEIDRLSAHYGSSTDEFKRLQGMKRDLYRQEQDTIMDTAQVAASAITAVFKNSKTAAIASAIVNTAVGVTRAFRDVPWPYNIAQAAMVAATGAAQIASIRSTNEKSGGGSVSSPSGGGGGGSGAESGGQTSSRSLTIQGVDRASLYSGDVVAALIENINQEVQNGATLISTRNVAI